MAQPVLASAAAAAPSVISALQPGQKGTPTYMPTMTPEQYALFNQMTGVGTSLSPLQGNTLEYMMQGGTANDYNTNALNTYYQNSIRNPAMQQLYAETLPGIGNKLASQYFSSNRVQAQNKAELGTRTQLQQQYGELNLQNELAKKQAQEEARTSGLSLLGQMQGQAMAAKPFDIVMKPTGSSSILSGIF